MTPVVLLLKFNVDFSERSRAVWEEWSVTTAEAMTETPGLRWKMWLLNEQESEFCGVYLFDDDAAVHNYLQDPILELIRDDTTNTNLSVQTYEVVNRLTAITHGPI